MYEIDLEASRLLVRDQEAMYLSQYLIFKSAQSNKITKLQIYVQLGCRSLVEWYGRNFNKTK